MRRVYAAYVLLGLVLWPLPLLNVLQVESAAVTAFVTFFVAGGTAIRHFRREEWSLGQELVQQEAALLLPLGMLTIAQLWAPNCTFGQGLLFYGLFPGITVVFAVALAYALTGMELSRPILALVGIGGLVSLAGPIYDLGFHPQLYTYNHVFGGVLGPIYDEQLAVRTGLFVFRGLTLLWASAAALLGARLRGRGPRWGLPVCALIIGMVYWFSAPLGITTPAEKLQHELDGHLQTQHFDLYYDPEQLGKRAVAALAADHEAYYAHLRERLAIEPGAGPERIQSYLYPNSDVKARLTGARATSVTPVWLEEPQVHLLVDRVDASLGHELAHVFSRSYGVPLLRASWAPGLVEGWAVALEPPDPSPSPHDLVSVATTADSVGALSTKAEAIAGRLTPWGFWTGRGAVSYATMGSFVRYLLDTYGPEPLKQVYAWGTFEAAYGRSLMSLAKEWANMLQRRPMVSRAAYDRVLRQFTRPSLFEKRCPHYVPPHRQHFQAAQRAARRGDSMQVGMNLRKALVAEPHYSAAHAALASRRLAQGKPDAVRQQLDTLQANDRPPVLRRLQGDAHAQTGSATSAQRLYLDAHARTPRDAHGSRMRLLLRTAVADRPSVIRVLTEGTTPHQQAQALAALDSAGTTAVRAWRALRLADAHRYVRADSVWRQIDSLPSSDWPRSWRQAWRIQRTAWHSEAAYRAGHGTAAARMARLAARQAEARGAHTWADMLEARAARAERLQRTGEGPGTAP
jgi:hypothetical protein